MNTLQLDINSPSNVSNLGELIYEVKDMAYISNGSYDATVKADNVWVDSKEGKNVLLRLYSADTENTFALKANNVNDIKTAKILPINQAELIIEKNVIASTSEQPETKSNFLYVSLNPNFNRNIIYRGKINYGIVNSF